MKVEGISLVMNIYAKKITDDFVKECAVQRGWPVNDCVFWSAKNSNSNKGQLCLIPFVHRNLSDQTWTTKLMIYNTTYTFNYNHREITTAVSKRIILWGEAFPFFKTGIIR